MASTVVTAGMRATGTHWLRTQRRPIFRHPIEVRIYWPVSDSTPSRFAQWKSALHGLVP